MAGNDDLLNASSLGTSGARRLRQRTSAAQADLTRAIAPLRDAVFISYRHDDPASGALAMLLEKRLGRSLGPDRVFDLPHHVTPGTTVAGALRGAIQRCSALVLIIGREQHWNLLRRTDDWVHIEVAYALQLETPLLMVTLDNVPMVMPGQLPSALTELAHRQSLRFSNTNDVNSLIETITRLVHPNAELDIISGMMSPPSSLTTRERGTLHRDAAKETGGQVATTRRAATTVTEPEQRRIIGAERQILVKDLVRRYNSGESIRAIAASTGRSYGFIHRVLTESGVQLRQRGGARRRKRSATNEDPTESPTERHRAQ